MNLQLIKQDKFNSILVDVYRNDDDDVFMTSKQLGEALEYAHPQRSIDKFFDNNDYLLSASFSVRTKMISTDGKSYNTRLLTEDGIYEITMLSKQPKAMEFRRFIRSLMKGLRKGELRIEPTKPENEVKAFEMQMIGAKHLAEMLRMDDASKLKITHDIYATNGLPTKALPQYVESEVTLSATELLKRNGKPMSVIKFNNAMIANGFLELKERPSSNDGTKEFKSLTEKGLGYGKNLVSPHNKSETQPQYYESKFTQLLGALHE